MHDFPAELYQIFVGKTIAKIEPAKEADEGLRFTFTDDTVLDIGFSGCEGTIETQHEISDDSRRR